MRVIPHKVISLLGRTGRYYMNGQTKILVVDDEPAIRELLVDALTPHGYQVFAAPDGESAVKIAVSEDPDIAFVDIRMAGMDGVQVLSRLKDISVKLQVIMITGHCRDEAVDSALRMGAGACLMKPFRMNEVVEMVQIMQLAA